MQHVLNENDFSSVSWLTWLELLDHTNMLTSSICWISIIFLCVWTYLTRNTWPSHWPKERRWLGICSQIWSAMGQPRQPKKNTKVTLQQEESLRLLKVWVMTWSVPDQFIMSILRGRCGMVNIHPVLNKKTKKLFPGGNWPESCWQKDSRGKGFAVRRLNKHSFCPASALRDRYCIDTKVLMWIHSC